MSTKKMKDAVADVVETTKTETAKAVAEISKAAEPLVESAKDEIEEMSKKVEEKAEPLVKKAEPLVKKAKAAAKKAEPAVKSATKTVKDTGKALASAIIPEVFVEYGDKTFTCTDLTERCRADFKATNKGVIRSCQIYVKPEDGFAYYVINDVQGKVSL